VVDIGVGNIVSSITSSTALLFFNSDSSAHTVTVYGPTGSQSYPIPAGGYLLLGRLQQLAVFAQPSDGSLWCNVDSATVKMAAFKMA
jgi:hypothetical protein